MSAGADPAGPTTLPRPSVAVHQFIPALIPRDATGTHTLLLREALRRSGWRSEIFAEATHDELEGESFRIEEYPRRAQDGDVLVYQLSTSSMVADFLLERPERLVLDYHNCTPPELYERWEPQTAERARRALEQLCQLAPRAELGLAVSHFNEADLTAAGCRRTEVVPVLADYGRAGTDLDGRVAARLAAARAEGGSDWLFVGRLVPSKGQHELVKALWAYRRLYDPRARLHLVGSAPSRRYLHALRAFIDDLGLGTAVRLAGEVSDAALGTYLVNADVYVSLSVHEGFGVPLIEAMVHGLPVIALAAGAIPETVGDSAVLLERSEPALVAAAADRVIRDAGLRTSLVKRGRHRAAQLDLARSASLTVAALEKVALRDDSDEPPADRVTTREWTAANSGEARPVKGAL